MVYNFKVEFHEHDIQNFVRILKDFRSFSDNNDIKLLNKYPSNS